MGDSNNNKHLTLLAPGLFVGDEEAAADEDLLKENHISVLINVAKGVDDPEMDGIRLYKFGISDGDEKAENDWFVFFAAAFTTLGLLARNETVLVHCKKGHSRSVAVAALVLAKRRGIDLKDALELITRKRPEALVAHDHMKHLQTAWDKLGATNAKR